MLRPDLDRAMDEWFPKEAVTSGSSPAVIWWRIAQALTAPVVDAIRPQRILAGGPKVAGARPVKPPTPEEAEEQARLQKIFDAKQKAQKPAEKNIIARVAYVKIRLGIVNAVTGPVTSGVFVVGVDPRTSTVAEIPPPAVTVQPTFPAEATAAEAVDLRQEAAALLLRLQKTTVAGGGAFPRRLWLRLCQLDIGGWIREPDSSRWKELYRNRPPTPPEETMEDFLAGK